VRVQMRFAVFRATAVFDLIRVQQTKSQIPVRTWSRIFLFISTASIPIGISFALHKRREDRAPQGDFKPLCFWSSEHSRSAINHDSGEVGASTEDLRGRLA